MKQARLLPALITLLFACAAAAQTVAIAPRFQSVGHFHNGLAPAQENDLWGFIDTTGAWVVQPQYEGVLRGKNGRFGIQQNGLWGFIDVGGEVVIAPAYDKAKPFSGGVAAVRRGDLWGFIAPSGAIETPLEFTDIGRREGRLFPARRKGEPWRTMRATAGLRAAPYMISDWNDGSIYKIHLKQPRREVRPSKVYGFSDGATVAVFDQGEALMDALGNAISGGGDPFYQSIRRRSEGVAAATRDGQIWGFIQKDGGYWRHGGYTAAREFSEGVAPVKRDGKWGYLNKKGQLALAPRYERAFSFHEGYATMRIGR